MIKSLSCSLLATLSLSMGALTTHVAAAPQAMTIYCADSKEFSTTQTIVVTATGTGSKASALRAAYDAQLMTGAPGDVLIMDANVVHASARNDSEIDRRALFLILNSIENQLVRPFGGQPPRPESITSRELIRL